MILTEPYTNIQRTMDLLKRQIVDSVDYCGDNFGGFKKPDDLYYYLKTLVTFREDKNGDEMIQTAQTLFENNIHGKPGFGDCDCFTVLMSACCLVNNFKVFVVLASNNPDYPTHIYNYVKWRGELYTLDLTQGVFNDERHYKYCQKLAVGNF